MTRVTRMTLREFGASQDLINYGFIQPLTYQHTIPIWSIQKRFKYLHRHAHYRLRKNLGKGNWWRYRERYVRPGGLETRKPLWFNYRPSKSDMMFARRWRQDLLENMQKATTPSQVLDAWIHFRHKRKSAIHYLKCLQRLTELKPVNIADWRYRTFARRLSVFYRRVLNLPKLLFNLAQLKDLKSIKCWMPRCYKTYHQYTLSQQIVLLQALSRVRFRDTRLFTLIGDKIKGHIMEPEMEARLLVEVLSAHASVMIKDGPLFTAISDELQRRVQLGAALASAGHNQQQPDDINQMTKFKAHPTFLQSDSETDDANETSETVIFIPPEETNVGEKLHTIVEPKTSKTKRQAWRAKKHNRTTESSNDGNKIPPLYLPSYRDLVKSALHFARLRVLDFGFFEMCAIQAHHVLSTKRYAEGVEVLGPAKTSLTPPLVTQLIEAFVTVDIRDYLLFGRVLDFARSNIHNFPPDDAANLIFYLAQAFPPRLRKIQHAYRDIQTHLFCCLDILSIHGITALLKYYTCSKSITSFPSEHLGPLVSRCRTLFNPETRHWKPLLVDIPALLHALLDLKVIDTTLFNWMSVYLQSQMDCMEPRDAISTLKAMKKADIVLGHRAGSNHPLFRAIQEYTQFKLYPEMTREERTMASQYLKHRRRA